MVNTAHGLNDLWSSFIKQSVDKKQAMAVNKLISLSAVFSA